MWISVEDRLPEDGVYVLIWFLGSWLHDKRQPSVFMGKYIDVLRQFRPYGGNGNFNKEITHWQPLPDPPE